MLRPDRSSARTIIACGTLGAALTLIGSALSLPITLYATAGCPPNYCDPMYALLPLPALALGAALGLVLPAGTRRIAVRMARGALLGLLSFVLVALGAAAAIPFHDPYFTLPYRLYAVLYVVAAAGAIVAWSVRHRTWAAPDRASGQITLAALVTLAAVLGASLMRREVAVAGAIAAGTVVGVAAALALGRRPVGRPRAEHLVAVIVIVAFVARAFFGLQTLSRTGPGMAFAVASDDGDSYFTLASRVVADPGAIGEVLAAVAFPPGYSLFVASLLGATRGSMAAVVVIQALLAGLASLLLFLIGQRVAGRSVGLVAAALYAADQNLIQNQSTLTAEALLLPTVLVVLWGLLRYRSGGRARWLVAGAAALGVAYLTRNLVAIPLAVAIVVWIALWRRPLRLVARDLAVVALAIGVATSPVAIATGIREGTPRLTTQLAALAWEFEGAEGMTIGNGPLLARDIRPFTDPTGSARRVLTDPGPVMAFFVAAVPQRVLTLLFFPNRGFSDPMVIANPATHTNAFAEVIALVRVVALLVGIVAGIRAWRARRDVDLVLLALFAILYLAAFSFLFPPYHPFRYRIPIEPIRYLAEAAGLIVLAGLAARPWCATDERAVIDPRLARAVGTDAS